MDPSAQDFPQTTMHVQRAVKGDLDSLEWVVLRLSPLLVAQAHYRLGPALRTSVDPEDLVNEAWAVALPRLAELGEKEGRLTPVLLKFLSTSMTFRINNLLRKKVTQDRSGPASEFARLPADQSGVITTAVRGERKEFVHQQLEALDPIDREVILLRGIEQHPAKTVAVMLDLTPAAVDKRYSRALKRLRESMPDSVFDEIEDHA